MMMVMVMVMVIVIAMTMVMNDGDGCIIYSGASMDTDSMFGVGCLCVWPVWRVCFVWSAVLAGTGAPANYLYNTTHQL